MAVRKNFDPAQIFLVSFCLVILFITIYPMYYVLILSISEPTEVAKGGIYFWPRGFYLGSYEVIIKDARLWRSYLNTIIYAGCSTLLMLFTTTIMAYPLTRPNLKFRKAVVFFPYIAYVFQRRTYSNFFSVLQAGAV